MSVSAVEPIGDKTLSWATVLADLAREAAEHERLFDAIANGDHGEDEHDLPAATPWTPPSGLGPVPVDLREQAIAVLNRQLALAARIAEAQTHNQQQQRLTERLDGGYGRTSAPAFFDAAL